MKRLLLFLFFMVLVIPASAYVVVPVEDQPEIPLAWVCAGLPPDVQIATGVAPFFVSNLTWVETDGDLVCQATLHVTGRGEVGKMVIDVSHEMLPVLKRWERQGAVIVPNFR